MSTDSGNEFKQEDIDEDFSDESEFSAASSTFSHLDLSNSDLPVLRGLLGKLGGDLQSFLPLANSLRSGNSKYKNLLIRLKKTDDEALQLEAISELCEILSMASEEILGICGFNTEQFMPVLVNLLRTESNIDMMVLSARAMTNLLEILPRSCSSAVKHGAVPLLCEKLLVIEYMDLAEQSLQVLEKISVDFPQEIVASHGLLALVQYVDFFQTSVQRIALRTACNSCRDFSNDHIEMMIEVLPLLTGLMQYRDTAIVESVTQAFRHLVDSSTIKKNKEILDLVVSHGLIDHLLELLQTATLEESQRPEYIQSSTTSLILHLVADLCRFSPRITLQLMQHGIIAILRNLVNVVGGIKDMHSLFFPSEQLCDILSVVHVLFPSEDDEERRQDLAENRDLSVSASCSLVPLLLDIYSNAVDQSLRVKSVSTLNRIFCVLDADILNQVLSCSSLSASYISKLVASLLCSKDTNNVLTALKIAMLLMTKVPNDIKQCFVREGVFEEIENLKKRSIQQIKQEKEFEDREPIASLTLDISQQTFTSSIFTKTQVKSCQVDELVSLNKDILELCEKLCTFYQNDAFGDEQTVFKKLYCISQILITSTSQQTVSNALLDLKQLLINGITTFELLKSDVCSALLHLLSDNSKLFSESMNLLRNQLLCDGLHELLMSKLQEALSCIERFPVLVTHGISSGGGRLDPAKGLNLLTQPLKLRLKEKIEDKEANLCSNEKDRNTVFSEIKNAVVLIEPLASCRSIEDFLNGKTVVLGAIGSNSGNEEGADEELVNDRFFSSKSLKPANASRSEMISSSVVHLDLFLNNKRLPKEISILEALSRYGMLSKTSCCSCCCSPRPSVDMWTQTFTIEYKKTSHKTNIVEDIHSFDKTEHLTSCCCDSLNSGESDEKKRNPLKRILELLNVLYSILKPTTEEEKKIFINSKLSSKIRWQLEDPVVVASNCLPGQTHDLLHHYAFLIPFDIRRHYLYATAFGVTRAMNYLQQDLWAIKTNLPRVIRVHRLKVRVSRSNILQSARKIMLLYSKQESILEIEFINEVGTGLGPTTEFYTSVCHELQRSTLDIWKNSEQHQLQRGDDNKDSSLQRYHKVPGYHRFAVVICNACGILEFPFCLEHKQLLTRLPEYFDMANLDWMSETQQALCEQFNNVEGYCSLCVKSTKEWIKTECSCGNIEKTIKWWVVCNEECSYISKAFPSNEESIRHPVLQCFYCSAVNFPGTEETILTVDSNSCMFTQSGRKMFEKDYRHVTSHLSTICQGTQLNQINVILLSSQVKTLTTYTSISPELLHFNEEYECEDQYQVDDYVTAADGLFPKAFLLNKTDTKNKQLKRMFTFIGRLIAKALLDNRLLDLPLSLTFIRAIIGDHGCLIKTTEEALENLSLIDKSFGDSFKELWKIAKNIENGSSDLDLTFKGTSLNTLSLAFSLPGNPDYVLSGSEKKCNSFVTLDNVKEYVNMCLNAILSDGIKFQIDCLKQGFSEVIPLNCLQLFDENELKEWFHGNNTNCLWDNDRSFLLNNLKCDHGYTITSKAIEYLVDILLEMSPLEHRLFLRFVTGSPRLPIGGFARLVPKLTVVKKCPEQGISVDQFLPSASTCTNYLKLPDYTTKDIMREKLFYCIHEGQMSFHLS